MALQLQTQATVAAPRTESGLSAAKRLLSSTKVDAKDRMFFTEQLALLLETGTPLHPALRSIRAQMSDSPMAKVLDDVAEGVVSGGSLSDQLARHPAVFSSTYVSLVAASEQGGFLHEVLSQLQKMDEQNTELRATLISSFSYPVFLIVFSIFTLIFILTVVFPKFAEMFASIGDNLPASTKVLMAASDVFVAHWPLLSLGLGGVLFATMMWARTDKGSLKVSWFKLRAPYIGRVWQRVYLVVAFRVLGLSIKNGVSLVDAVRTSQEVVNNELIRAFFVDLSKTIENGGRLTDGLQDAAWMPDLAKQMVSTAEESGSLPTVLLRVSDYYQKELERLLQRFSKMIEPIMLVVMGAMVGLLVSSLILPIFKLSHAVT